MSDLIKALQILLKYGDPKYPTDCEHGVMIICCIDPDFVTDDDINELEALGVVVDEQENHFFSSRFGSC